MEINSVLLGIVDSPLSEDENDDFSYTINKIGGVANWPTLHGQTVVNNNRPSCRLCGLKPPLLVQVYAPLSGSKYHRTLYIYACINPECQNNGESWICLRSQCIVEDFTIEENKEQDDVDDNFTWCNDQDDWIDNSNQEPKKTYDLFSEMVHDGYYLQYGNDEKDSSDESDVVDNEVANVMPLQESDLCLTMENDQFSHVNFENGEFISFSMISTEEVLPSHTTSLPENYDLYLRFIQGSQIPSESIIGAITADAVSVEKYEKNPPKHGMKLFHSFVKRIKHNPEQILRYSRNNKAPKFLYEEPKVPSRCNYCDGELIFEMQILPSIIRHLKLKASPDVDLNELLDFGSAFIYTCKNSCWNETDVCKEEPVVVQKENLRSN